MKSMDNFCNTKETITWYHQITLFAISNDEFNVKKDTGESMKHLLYVLGYAKRHAPLRLNQHQTVQKKSNP